MLSAGAKIKSQIGFNRVVPLRKGIVRVKLEQAKLIRRGVLFGLVEVAVKVGRDREAGFSGSGANEVENLLIAVEGLAGPVFGDFREEAMFDGVPLRGACGEMGDSEIEAERVGELRLKFSLPGAITAAITAAGVGQDEELARARITEAALALPPVSDGMNGEGRSIGGDA